ncbi:pyruvate dehydrogenase protein X component, mitochondrial-like [Tubulanus polymorphus]|uniref:pyruvate dehydrogenase protein X component, mitochondrial-like n=1 Tax=Tubulanus polymorphus TaxID=672921 RepID=UPI003DA36B07
MATSLLRSWGRFRLILGSNIGRSAATRRVIPAVNPTRLFSKSCRLDVEGIKLVMPALSPTMTEGTIVKWHKKEGDSISAGDVLCDVQTDKAVVSFELEEDGILAKIVQPENSKDLKIGTLIGLMVEEGDDWQNVEMPTDVEPDAEQTATDAVSSDGPRSEAEHQAPATAPAPAPRTSAPSAEDRHGHGIGPAVRNLLDLYHISPSEVFGTGPGPHSWITKGDVLKYISEKGLQPVSPEQQQVGSAVPQAQTPPAPEQQPARIPERRPDQQQQRFTDHEVTSMRRTIAKRLTESKTTIPHSNSTIDCKMDAVIELRNQFKAKGTKVSVNDFIIKAAAVALKTYPEVNAIWNVDGPRLLNDVDVCVAVATDSGLITPIVKNADKLGISAISESVKDLATRARDGKLQPHEFQGGSFTISNLGMFGITQFSAVINPPQACILAIGASRFRLDSDSERHTTMSVTLSSDVRVVDDATAARFLAAFRTALEDPLLMLVERIPRGNSDDQMSAF